MSAIARAVPASSSADGLAQDVLVPSTFAAKVVEEGRDGGAEGSEEVLAQETENGVELSVHRSRWEVVRSRRKVGGDEERERGEEFLVRREDANVLDPGVIVIVPRTACAELPRRLEETTKDLHDCRAREVGLAAERGTREVLERDRLDASDHLAEVGEELADIVENERAVAKRVAGKAVDKVGRGRGKVGGVGGEVVLGGCDESGEDGVLEESLGELAQVSCRRDISVRQREERH